MSLVAYASSDDEGSDGDEKPNEEEVRPVLKEENQSGRVGKKEIAPQDYDIEDDDWGAEQLNKRKSIFSVLPPPSQKANEFEILEEGDPSDFGKQKTGLPSLQTEVEAIRKESVKSVDNEKSAKLDASKRVMKLALPKPKSSGKSSTKQTMKITLPDVDSDSDEETNERKTKAKLTGKKGTGLMSILPKPKNNIRAQIISVNKPTERKPKKLMVPYTISKKKEEVKKISSKDEDSGSESDGEAGESFFSLNENNSNIIDDTSEKNPKGIIDNTKTFESSVKPQTAVSNYNTATATEIAGDLKTNSKIAQSHQESSISFKPCKNEHDSNAESCKSNVKVDRLSTRVENISRVTENVTGPYEQNIVTGLYGSGSGSNGHNSGSTTGTYGLNSVSGLYVSESGPYSSCNGAYIQRSVSSAYGAQSTTEPNSQNVTGPYQANVPYEMSQQYGASNVPGPYQGIDNLQANDGAYGNYGTFGGSNYLNPDPSGQYTQYQETNQQSAEENALDMEQLRRLQGKRERRVQQVDIIDIQGENMQMDSTDLLKNFTEENQHISKKSKTDSVSSQQKRKHQITYLAFQAKEREQALKKSWATSHQSKRQTRQKYGF